MIHPELDVLNSIEKMVLPEVVLEKEELPGTQVKGVLDHCQTKKTSRKNEDTLVNEPSIKNSEAPKSRTTVRTQTAKNKVEDASFVQKSDDLKRTRTTRRSMNTKKRNSDNSSGRYSVGSKRPKPRDNSSRFDD